MSLSYKPGDTVYVEFCTQIFATGVATNADSLPAGTLNRNGTDDGAVTVTVTNLDAGRYKASFTVPATYVPGDVLNLTMAATVSSVAGKAAVWNGRVGVGLQASGTAAAGGASSITLQTALGADSLAVGSWIALVAGTGAGQIRLISAYVNSTKVVTTNRAWVTNPDNTSVYAILPGDSPSVDASGRLLLQPTQTGVTFASLTCTGRLAVQDGVRITCTTTDREGIYVQGDGDGQAVLLKSFGAGDTFVSQNLGSGSAGLFTSQNNNGLGLSGLAGLAVFGTEVGGAAILVSSADDTAKSIRLIAGNTYDFDVGAKLFQLSFTTPNMVDATATLGANAITTASIKDGAITDAKIAAAALDGKGDWLTDKAGFSLAATGLDAITATVPTGIATTFPQMMVQEWWRACGGPTKYDATAGYLYVYQADASTVIYKQPVTVTNTTQTVGKAVAGP